MHSDTFKNKNTVITINHGSGSIMLRVCFTATCSGDSHKLNRIIKTKVLISDSVIQELSGGNILGFYTDPKHSSILVFEWTKQEDISLLQSAQS